jgi:hypothetical protein
MGPERRIRLTDILHLKSKTFSALLTGCRMLWNRTIQLAAGGLVFWV